MSIPVEVKSSASISSTNPFYLTMPTHVAGDLLLVVGHGRYSAATVTCAAGTALTSIGNQTNCSALWKIAESSSEVFSSNYASAQAWQVICIQGAHATAPIKGSAYTSITGGAYSIDSGTIDTTGDDDCLIVHAHHCDAGSGYRNPFIPRTMVAPAYGYSSVSCSFEVRHGAGVSTARKLWGSTNAGGNWQKVYSIAIKNAATTDIDLSIKSHPQIITQWGGALGASGLTVQAPNAVATMTLLDGIKPYTAGSTNGVSNPSGWANSIQLSESAIPTVAGGYTGGAWMGTIWSLTSTIDIDGKTVMFPVRYNPNWDSRIGADGTALLLVDSSDSWVAFQLHPQTEILENIDFHFLLSCSALTPWKSYGTMAWNSLKRWGFLHHRTADSSGYTNYLHTYALTLLDAANPAVIVGHYASAVSIARMYAALYAGAGGIGHTFKQGRGQLIVRMPLQIGDGTTKTAVSLSGQSIEFPAVDATLHRISNNSINMTIYASANDTMNFAGSILATEIRQTMTIHASSSTSAAYNFAGLAMIGWDVTWKTGIPCESVSFSMCYTVDMKGADVTACNITSPAGAAALSFTESGATVASSTIDLTGTSADYHISLGASVTAFEINGTTLSGTPGTDKFYSALASGTLTITTDGTGTAIADTDVTFIGGSTATAVIASPTTYRGLNFTGLVDGSKVKVFTAGSQTVLFGTDSVTGNAFAFDDSTSGSTTVDYTIQKAGYVPIRVTGAALNSSTVSQAIGRPDTAVNQVIDRAYVASSGLTYGTTAVVTVGTNPTTNPGTKTFALSAASTGQNWYSFWIEQWIDKGDTGEALANVEFPLSPNGPNSFTLNDGWTFSDGATSIAFLTRDGLRYLNTSDVLQKAWAAILTSGAGNNQVRYQQSDGGTTSNGTMVSNEMDQLVQIYDVGVFDYRGYLVLKIQAEGYDQAEANVVTLYGTLEDQLYVVGLTPAANGIATGNPTVTLTLDRGTYNDVTSGKTFGIRIVSAASGEDILRELRYNFGAGGEYPAASGYDGFDWHDLVQVNGADFKTVRGNIYGTAAVKGVVVYSTGTTLHPDFTLFTADDGTTYAPAVTADISITSMPDAGAVPTRLQIINSTATGASAWVANTVYATGAIVKRTTGLGSESTAGLYFRATTGGTSHATTEPTWDTTVGNTTADNTVVWTTYAVLYYDADPAATSLTDTYIDGEEFLAGEVAEIRFAEMNDATSFKTYSTEVAITAAGFSALVAEEADGVYATNALDGSAYETTFSPDFANDYMVLDTNTDFAGKAAYAYYCYTLTTSAGMWGFWGGVTALDEGNYRINTAILNMYFDESAGFVKQTDDVRIFRDDGTRPAIDPTTGGHGIEINWRTPVNTIAVGSAVTSQDKTDIIDGVWSRVLPL